MCDRHLGRRIAIAIRSVLGASERSFFAPDTRLFLEQNRNGPPKMNLVELHPERRQNRLSARSLYHIFDNHPLCAMFFQGSTLDFLGCVWKDGFTVNESIFLFKRTRVLFPAFKEQGDLLPGTLAPGDLMPFSGCCGYIHR